MSPDGIRIKVEEIQEDVLAIGMLIGLLSKDGDDYGIDLDWFKDPPKYLVEIDQRIDRVILLLNKYIGPAIKNTPVEPKGMQWYQIPDPGSDEKTPFYIVAPSPEKTKGDLGFGFVGSYQVDKDTTIKIYTYIPFFSYSSSGTKFVTNDPGYPSHLGLTLASKNPFVDGKTYGLNIDSEIYFSETTPTFEFAFLDQKGGVIGKKYKTVQELLEETRKKLINAVIAKISKWLNDTKLGKSISLGEVLVAADILSKDKDGIYSLNSEKLGKLTSEEIALNFVFGLLDKLAGSKEPTAIAKLPGGGLYMLKRSNKDGDSDYGLRLAFDVALPITTSKDGTPTRQFTLSSGSWLKGEDSKKNWMSASKDFPEPGITLYLLNVSSKKKRQFLPKFSLSSIGFDIAGAGQTPLFNLKGYSLQGAQLRGSFDFSTKTWGTACMLNSLALPLGAGLGAAAGGSGKNPVAQNLLASGSSGKGGDKDPVNPKFSVSAAYIKGGSLKVQLYDKDGKPAEVVLIPVNRALGPLQCDRLGIGWVSSEKKISLLFDGSVQLAALNIALQGLSIGIPVTKAADFSEYDLDLKGMGVTFSESDIEVSGTLVKVPPDDKATPPRDYVQYNGAALVKGGTFTISALGSYAYVKDSAGEDGYTSLFVFGMYIGDLGGPPFFYVTGVAAGFGYNRGLVLPAQDKVPEFPLVAAVSDPKILGGEKLSDGSWKSPDPATALSKIGEAVPPQRGQYWFAAGVRFTSFDLVNSSALVVAKFGSQLEISLVGLSWMSLPPPSAPGAPAPTKRYAYAELGLEVKFLPSEGFLAATALLTPNSFVIDPDCKLTGGFAFYIWFGDNPHAGEFVVTLGGYHPDFTPPSYYPTVPRLGFNWKVTSEVTISGDAYFALTPSAVMAGARLQVLFSRGDLNAWFNAQMDALIVWAPFHYVIDIRVSIGASYRVDLWLVTATLKVELNAGLTIWGPRMGGEVYIDWYVISFTIAFGASRSEGPRPLEWTNTDGTGFAQSLLPHRTIPRQVTAMGPFEMLGKSGQVSGSVEPSGILTIEVNSGLLSTINRENEAPVWVVRPNNLVFTAQSRIPATEVEITPASGKKLGAQFLAARVSPDGSDYFVCIRPMKATLSSSKVTITLTRVDDKSTYDLAGKFSYDMALSRAPAAKWGRPVGDKPEPNALLDGRLFGIENVSPRDPVLTPNGSDILEINIATAYDYDVVDGKGPKHLPLDVNAGPVGPVPTVDTAAVSKIESSVMDKHVVDTRDDVFMTLQAFGINALTNGALDKFAANPAAVLTGNPLIVGPD